MITATLIENTCFVFADYLNAAINLLKESWDDVILEMDSKLLNFSQGQTLQDDLMELIVFGTLTEPLRDILLHKVSAQSHLLIPPVSY